jgi:hypothetical protein
MNTTSWPEETDQYNEFRNNATLDTMEYVADNLPLLKDEIFDRAHLTEEWERYRHISSAITENWGRNPSKNSKSDPIFQFGIDATKKAFKRMRSWDEEKYEFVEENLEMQVSYKESEPNFFGYSAYLTSDTNYNRFIEGVFSAYGNENPSFLPLWNNAIGAGQFAPEFNEAIFALPIFVGYLERDRLLHVEMLVLIMRLYCGTKSFYLYLPEYQDVNSQRWIKANLKRLSNELLVEFHVHF